jgi:uncharacterized protein (DUF433 family)
MSRWIKIAGLAVLSIGLAVGVLATTTDVFAQDDEPTPTPDGGFFGFGMRGGHRGGMMGGFRSDAPEGWDPGLLADYMPDHQTVMAELLGLTVDELEAARDEGKTLNDLLDEAGLTVDDVKAALEEAHTAAVNAALADGAITQEQADWLLEMPFGLHGKGFFGMGFDMPHTGILSDYLTPVDDVVAATLGISVEDLAAARDEGKTLSEIAEEHGKTLEDIQAALDADYQSAIDAALADGAITEEQAEALRDMPYGGRGRGGLFGGMGFSGTHMGILSDYMPPVDEILAGVLGITVDEFDAARAEGQSLSDLADEHGVTLEDLEAAVEAAREEAISAALADGAITEEQAEALRAMPSFGGGCPGGRGMRGGAPGLFDGMRGGMMDWFDGDSDA